MNNVLTYGIIISMILGISAFVASNNIIVGVLVLLISFLYFFFIARKMINKYLIKLNRFHECYHFINTFIVALSIKGVISSAYETSVESMPDEFNKNIENLETFDQQEKLNHLNKYFRFHLFSLFVDLITLYENQGGDILEMSHYLLDELRLTEEYISSTKTISKKRIVEFAILWFLTLGIMIFLRFALSYFFKTISKQIFYPIGIMAICLFCLISIHIAISKLCNLQIRGWNDAEKI